VSTLPGLLRDAARTRVIEFVDDLPLTPAGEIQRAALRQRVAGGP